MSQKMSKPNNRFSPIDADDRYRVVECGDQWFFFRAHDMVRYMTGCSSGMVSAWVLDEGIGVMFRDADGNTRMGEVIF